MDLVHDFKTALKNLYRSKTPIPRSRIQLVASVAIKATKMYKHVVMYMEKYADKIPGKYKLTALCVIDTIIRASIKEFGKATEPYAPRFKKKLKLIFQFLKKCRQRDKSRMVRIVTLWQKHKIYNSELIEPLLSIISPELRSHKKSKATDRPVGAVQSVAANALAIIHQQQTQIQALQQLQALKNLNSLTPSFVTALQSLQCYQRQIAEGKQVVIPQELIDQLRLFQSLVQQSADPQPMDYRGLLRTNYQQVEESAVYSALPSALELPGISNAPQGSPRAPGFAPYHSISSNKAPPLHINRTALLDDFDYGDDEEDAVRIAAQKRRVESEKKRVELAAKETARARERSKRKRRKELRKKKAVPGNATPTQDEVDSPRRYKTQDIDNELERLLMTSAVKLGAFSSFSEFGQLGPKQLAEAHQLSRPDLSPVSALNSPRHIAALFRGVSPISVTKSPSPISVPRSPSSGDDEIVMDEYFNRSPSNVSDELADDSQRLVICTEEQKETQNGISDTEPFSDPEGTGEYPLYSPDSPKDVMGGLDTPGEIVMGEIERIPKEIAMGELEISPEIVMDGLEAIASVADTMGGLEGRSKEIVMEELEDIISEADIMGELEDVNSKADIMGGFEDINSEADIMGGLEGIAEEILMGELEDIPPEDAISLPGSDLTMDESDVSERADSPLFSEDSPEEEIPDSKQSDIPEETNNNNYEEPKSPAHSIISKADQSEASVSLQMEQLSSPTVFSPELREEHSPLSPDPYDPLFPTRDLEDISIQATPIHPASLSPPSPYASSLEEVFPLFPRSRSPSDVSIPAGEAISPITGSPESDRSLSPFLRNPSPPSSPIRPRKQQKSFPRSIFDVTLPFDNITPPRPSSSSCLSDVSAPVARENSLECVTPPTNKRSPLRALLESVRERVREMAPKQVSSDSCSSQSLMAPNPSRLASKEVNGLRSVIIVKTSKQSPLKKTRNHKQKKRRAITSSSSSDSSTSSSYSSSEASSGDRKRGTRKTKQKTRNRKKDNPRVSSRAKKPQRREQPANTRSINRKLTHKRQESPDYRRIRRIRSESIDSINAPYPMPTNKDCLVIYTNILKVECQHMAIEKYHLRKYISACVGDIELFDIMNGHTAALIQLSNRKSADLLKQRLEESDFQCTWVPGFKVLPGIYWDSINGVTYVPWIKVTDDPPYNVFSLQKGGTIDFSEIKKELDLIDRQRALQKETGNKAFETAVRPVPLSIENKLADKFSKTNPIRLCCQDSENSDSSAD